MTSRAPQLRFPNTSNDVEFTGYDAQDGLVEFHKVVVQSDGAGPNMVPDPSDPGTHRLPMASGATVRSIDPRGFPFEACPPRSCTASDIVASVIGHNNDAFCAHIHVNAADQIDSVRQSAY
ncbi:MAG TPA: hypothetical protein VFX16_28045 [Pseudonocardiaceae bacterium]|nr:hypothetical protein [Pseudonocardiaceae bacterium]